ncbi:MAG: hypothetical protein CVT62_11370 [Actinobacteria bacterium HGW-Actinobacteria-2]|nr:MAG: hypothetical protein CVT62_11370 [Actinobacteria bacterium HGW-Actinobacteria-2]
MPSFRASVAITALRAGADPSAAQQAAQAAVARTCHVEDAFVDVEPLRSGGLPRVTIRFVVPWTNDADEDAAARRVGKDLAAGVGQVAGWRDLRVFRRLKGRWLLLDGA